MCALLNFLQNYFESNDAIHSSAFTLLHQAQYERILGNYETALQKAQLAAATAPGDTIQTLTKRVYCMLQLESTGQAYLIDHSTGSGDCLATSGKSNAPHSKVETNNPMAAPKVAAYPNPTSGPVNLEFSFEPNTVYDLSVHNMLGRRVYEMKLTKESNAILIPPNIASGAYIVTLSNNNLTLERSVLVLNR